MKETSMCKQTYSHLLIKIQKQCTVYTLRNNSLLWSFFSFQFQPNNDIHVYMINHGELVQNENGELKAYFEWCVDRVLIIWGELNIW
jgi:hypothetical protein